MLPRCTVDFLNVAPFQNKDGSKANVVEKLWPNFALLHAAVKNRERMGKIPK